MLIKIYCYFFFSKIYIFKPNAVLVLSMESDYFISKCIRIFNKIAATVSVSKTKMDNKLLVDLMILCLNLNFV